MDAVVYNKIDADTNRILAAIRRIPTGEGTDLSLLEVYVADFLEEPPIVTEGALNAFHRVIVS